MLLAPSCDRTFKLEGLLSIPQHQASAASLSCFLKRRAKVHICGLSLATDSGQLSVHAHKMYDKARSHHCWQHSQRTSHTQGICWLVSRICKWDHCRGLWGLLDGVHNAANKACLSLVPFKSSICCSTSLFLPPSHAAHNSVLWWGRREMVSLVAFSTAEAWWKLTPHFPFPFRRNNVLGLFWHWVVPWGSGDVSSAKLSLLSSPMCPNLFVFAPVVCWHFSAENMDFCKGCLFCEWLPTVFSRASGTTPERD